MKKLFFLSILFFSLSIVPLLSQALAPPPCGMQDIPTSNFTPSPPNTACVPDGVLNGRDENPNYTPSQNDDRDFITIELVLHSFGRFASDPQNFTEEDIPYLLDVVKVMNNNILGEVNCPIFNSGGACTCDDTYCEIVGGNNDCCINDAKIQFTLAEEDIYFWTDELAWSGDGPGNLVDGCPGGATDYMDQNYAKDEDCKINVYFINTKPYSGCGPGWESEDFDFVLISDAYERFITDPDYTANRQQEAGIMTHELGHNMGLHHAWRNDQVTLFSPELEPNISNDWCNPSSDFNCSNNVMASSSVSNWLSPLQIAHMHRLAIGSWRSKTTRVDADPLYNRTITAGNDEQWDFGRINRGNITIAAGATLTIACKVLMASGSTILVEPGGKLVIDGGHLSMGKQKCEEKWRGIEIMGNPSESQFPFSNQGEVEIRNGGLIEFAQVGIDVGSGGIVDAINGTIKDCNIGVSFSPYDNFLPNSGISFRNISRFVNFAFNVTDDYSENDLDAMARLDQVDGVIFTDCLFDDLRSVPVDNINLTSRGILSSNAGFRVSNGTTFQKLYIGIEAGSFNNARTFSIRNASFDDCYVGLQSNGVNSLVFRDNILQVGSYDLGFNIIDGIGAVISNGTHFIIRDNKFSGIPGLTIGLSVNNSGASNNLIEKNEFESLTAGNYANGINVDLNNPFIGGLEYLCNDNNLDNLYDFYIYGQGIGLYQGEEERAAGNTFNLNTTPDGSDYNNNTGFPVNYWLFDGDVAQDPENTIALFKRDGVDPDCASDDDDEEDLLESDKESKYIQKFNENRNSFLNNLTLLESKIDEGNTTLLLQRINAISNPNSYQYQQLITSINTISPYLSQQVLEEIAETTTFTTQVFLNIAQDNPDLLKIGNFIDQLAISRNLTSQQKDDLINSGITNTSERFDLERSTSKAFGDMQAAGRKLLVHIAADEQKIEWTDFQNRLNEMEDLPSRYAMYSLLKQLGNTAQSEVILNNEIPSMISGSDKLVKDHSDFLTVQNVYSDLVSNSENWNDLSSTDLNALYDLRDSEINLAASQAHYIINFYYNERHVTIPVLPSSNSAIQTSSGVNQYQIPNDISITDGITAEILAFPNPTKDQVEFRYSEIRNNTLPTVLEVFDITGKLLFEQSITSDTGNILWVIPDGLQGLVMYSIRVGDSKTSPQKLVILP